jgi:hypothetical protein
MVSIRVGDNVYGLDDSSSAELLRRLEDATPVEEGVGPRSTFVKLRGAVGSDQSADLDDGDLALIGVVVEAWAVEVDGDLPPDVEELRYAVSDRLG